MIFPELKQYGVLLYPAYRGFHAERNAIEIGYSISIPLTDVGKGVSVEIGLNKDIRTGE